MTRASWLGIGIVIIIGLVGILITAIRGKLHSTNIRNYIFLMVFVVIATGITLAIFYGDQLLARVLRENNVIVEALQGNLTKVPYTSIGFRIHAWHYALQLIAEQPWFGWGPKSHIPLLLQSTNPVGDTTLGAISARDNLTHFHSSYVTILVANGIAGFMVFLTAVVTIGVSAFRSWRRGDMPGDVMIFLSLFFIFWAIVNLFESYMAYRTGVYVIGAVGGMAYTYSMRRRLNQHAQT